MSVLTIHPYCAVDIEIKLLAEKISLCMFYLIVQKIIDNANTYQHRDTFNIKTQQTGKQG